MKFKKIRSFFQNTNWNKILDVLLWSQLLLMLLIILGFVSDKEKMMLCKYINISVDNEAIGNYFVESQDIKELIYSKGNALIGQPMRKINVQQLEEVIRNNPFVENAEVYLTIDGEVNVEVKQRIPLVRIINSVNESFYIDKHGTLMPVSDKYAARVPIATGNILEKYSFRGLKTLNEEGDTLNKNTMLDTLFFLAKYIEKNEFVNSLVEQIYVNEENEIELIPRIGHHQIIIGDVTNLDEKFKKLLIFYKKGLNKAGWNEYSTINLKYKDQVVCTKNESQ